MQRQRRIFLFAAAAGPLLGVARSEASPAMLDPKDPQAAAFGYTPDASKIDPAFVAKHASTAHCGECALFQGKPGDAQAGCPLFGGKLVQNQGWCGSWVQRA